jgi:hypothetical protein
MERQEIDQMVTWLTVIRDLGLLTYKGFQWRFTEKIRFRASCFRVN